MLARPLVVAAAVLLTAGVGSLALPGGTSAATSPARVVYGPVALPVAAPLGVPLGGRLGPPFGVPRAQAEQPVLLAAPVPLGPRAVAAEMGPPGLVGPDSPAPQVRAVQRLLNRAGAGLRVDGAWGPATTRAVKEVQARAGLPVDGRAGPRTLAHLRERPSGEG